jgi:murein DD-endopeptidase MepM/ murein hydrolase activator NlpD
LITVRQNGKSESFLFVPGLRYNAMERAFFLEILFRNPLPGSRITSWFGRRVSPISGELHFHSGLDMAAPEGTPVYPAREGTVIEAGYNATLGNFVRVSHPGGYQTTYGHLKKILVVLNQTITSSIILGEVGSTGMSTGPHLHFELRRNGEPVDPLSLIGVN